MTRRGVALLIAALGAGLAALVTLTALLTAERAMASARAWSGALRVEAHATSALDGALAHWPALFTVPCCGQAAGPATDVFDGVEVRIWMHSLSDSLGLLVAEARSGLAERSQSLLVRLRADSAEPTLIGGAVPLGSGRDWLMLRP